MRTSHKESQRLSHPKTVSRNLLTDKLIVRDILIERTDYIIPISAGPNLRYKLGPNHWSRPTELHQPMCAHLSQNEAN